MADLSRSTAPLTAEATIAHPEIAKLVEQVMQEHAEAVVGSPAESPAKGMVQFKLHYGELDLVHGDQHCTFVVRARDETTLSYCKMTVALQVSRHMGTTSGIRWTGDGQTSGTPVFFRELTVLSSHRVGPHMQRLTFWGDDIARFAEGGLHLRILIPPKDRTPVWPVMGSDGLLVWPQGEDELTVRVYTIRKIDVEAGTIEIDFVMHPGVASPAAVFALTAKTGDLVGIVGPVGEGGPAARNLLMFGDDTAIPAISRIVEMLPDDSRATIYLEVDSPADVVPLERDNVAIHWLFRKGSHPGTTGALTAALTSIERDSLPAETFVWAGCEFSDFREIRRILKKDWQLPKDRMMVVAYWRRGANGDEARSEAAA